MSHVDLEELAGVALDHDDTSDEVRRHVASCPECRAVVASLAEARHLAGEGPLVAPPRHVRDRVLAHVRTPGAAADAPTSAPSPPIPLRRGSHRTTGTGQAPSGRRGVPVWAAGLAAALALVAGLGLGRVLGDGDAAPEAVDPPTQSATVVAAADLTALDSDAARGEASAVRSEDTVTLRVRARELGEEDGFHEVWLINVDGTRMVALGVLANGDAGEFQVPRGLIDDGYRIVDISIEPEDGDPTHSGVSLARGELA
ncbi:anti-sigma factor [Nocardioides renjunii]|uniref:anti-sigma factor n=1 Tax=Nocardioides renjunii TaxID=3095075 RepID=UPI002AFECB7D|nr:anti-sigma factor [Nocardioides sp. S-34]WQQ23055.1 anti-sigma factor [Nocardioides sp. S-34]